MNNKIIILSRGDMAAQVVGAKTRRDVAVYVHATCFTRMRVCARVCAHARTYACVCA